MHDLIAGVALALTYPDEALTGRDQALIERCASIVRRAGDGQDTISEAKQLLLEDELLAEWIAQVSEDPERRPPHLRPDTVRSYKPVHNTEVVTAKRYVCQADGFIWYRRTIADKVPPCPYDGATLIG